MIQLRRKTFCNSDHYHEMRTTTFCNLADRNFVTYFFALLRHGYCSLGRGLTTSLSLDKYLDKYN